MSEKVDDKGNEAPPKTLTDDEIVETPMQSRRSALRMIGTLVAGSVVGAIVTLPGIAEATTDRDPNDASGHGRTGRSDSDSNDAAGHGRVRRRRVRSGATDRDPNDSAGHGHSGHTDRDPNDAAGHGR
ncbi:MAG: hypothetical protein WCJ30_17980 [Deltaproteobacteria bacterium]